MTPELGKLITSGGARDAIHVAVAPVVASERLKPGTHVGLLPNGTASATCKTLGVVDPYLKQPVQKGETFWLCLYPNTVTSLRHEWEHPDFGKDLVAEKDRAEAVAWLTDYAEKLELTLEELVQATEDFLRNGDSYCLSTDTPDFVWSDRKEFWVHYQIMTGKVLHPDKWEETFFRCAC